MDRDRPQFPLPPLASLDASRDSLLGARSQGQEAARHMSHNRHHSESDPIRWPSQRPFVPSRLPSDPFVSASDDNNSQRWLDIHRYMESQPGGGRLPHDFLTSGRARGNTAPRDESRDWGQRPESRRQGATGTDRKRRLTGPKSPGRRGGHGSNSALGTLRPSTGAVVTSSSSPTMPTAGAIGGPTREVIDLTSSPEASPPQPRATAPNVIRPPPMNEVILPSWQPDSEVSECPVCGTHFSFFYRKHHCRKCGRVVCGNCSPHRIMIPRQFIVHPPASSSLIDLTSEDDTESPFDRGSFANSALGGGEAVRVCNPCVPDPNNAPPPQPSRVPATTRDYRFPMPTYYDGRSQLSSQDPQYNMHLDQAGRQARYSSQTMPTFGHRQSLSDIGHRRFSPDGMPTGMRRMPLPDVPSFVDQTDGNTSSSHPPAVFMPRPPHHHHSHRHHRDHSRSNSGMNPYLPSMLDIRRPLPNPPPPRRQIPEEDECPVCGDELPPKEPDGSTVARERHIEECIRSHTLGGTPRSHPHASPAVDGGITASVATSSQAGSGSATRATGSSTPVQAEGSRQRRGTSRGMAVSIATEKECTDEDGNPLECIICFEEFEPGDQLGRLECLCKFHKKCIREWWDKKGVGACPTHQLHD